MSLGTYFLTFRKNRGAFVYQKGCIFIYTAVLTPSLENTSLAMELREISLSILLYTLGGCALPVMTATHSVELTVLQLVKKFSEIYRTRHFIASFTTARRLYLS